MSRIVPFSAIRPAPELVTSVVSHPVVAYTKSGINKKLSENPVSFLQIIFAGRENKQDSDGGLGLIKQKFNDFIANGVFERDSAPCFYIYRQIKDDNPRLGIIALASIEDYNNGIIKVHEHTLRKRVKKLTDYLSVCDFNAEPVSIAYPNDIKVAEFLKEKAKGEPLYDFISDLVRHTVWKISRSEDIKMIIGFFNKIPSLYIADGHHRVASSAMLAQVKRKQNKRHTGKEPYNFFMAAFFAENQLSILNFDRMCTTLNGLTPDSFLAKLSQYFEIHAKGKSDVKPALTNEIGMYLAGQWYLLKGKQKKSEAVNPVDALDVSLLSDNVFASILNITDQRNDKRIVFVPGAKRITYLQKLVDKDKMKVAFRMHPISFMEIKAVADSGGIMPPKSTWIEPKLENGLLIYSLS